MDERQSWEVGRSKDGRGRVEGLIWSWELQGVRRNGEWEGGRDGDGRVSDGDGNGMRGGLGIEDGLRKEGKVGKGRDEGVGMEGGVGREEGIGMEGRVEREEEVGSEGK